MNVIKNFIYNMGYQVLLIGSSLILAPYLSRVIGAEGIGIYSYTYSIAVMFGIAANLVYDFCLCSGESSVCCAAVLIFICDREDIELYILLMALSFFLIHLILCFFLPKFVDLRISARYALKRHAKSIVLLFFCAGKADI